MQPYPAVHEKRSLERALAVAIPCQQSDFNRRSHDIDTELQQARGRRHRERLTPSHKALIKLIRPSSSD